MTQGWNIPWFSESMCRWPAFDPLFFSGGAIEILSFDSYTGKQELGGVRVWSGEQ